MNKLWVFLLLILILTSCKSDEKKNYGEGFKKIWSQKDLDWNTTSLINKDDIIYGLTLDNKLFKAEIRTGRLIWVRPALPNYESQKPLIINSDIFIGGRDSIYSYDVNGNLNWKKNTGQKITHTLIADKFQLIGSVSSKGLYSFEQKTGNVLWAIEPANQMLLSSNPILSDSLIIVGDFDYKVNIGKSLFCFNVRNRQVNWSYPTSNYFTSEAEVNNGKVIINLDSSYANGFTKTLDIKSGKLIWKRKTFPNIHSKPFYLNGKLFVGSYKYGLLCLNPTNGNIIWSLNLNKDYPSTKMLLYNNEIVFGTFNRDFYAVSLNGKVTRRTEFEYGLGDPFIFNDTLYINTGGGEMFKNIKTNALTKSKKH